MRLSNKNGEKGRKTAKNIREEECVCVCVCVKEREGNSVYVCLYVGEREVTKGDIVHVCGREREKEIVCMRDIRERGGSVWVCVCVCVCVRV